MKVHRSISEPIRTTATWDERWKGNDRGLIACWERGREKSVEDPALAAHAREGRLVLLPWKGGIEKVTKAKQKIGTHFYLAMWQGLRGDDLDIDLEHEHEHEVVLTCTTTGMAVAFTGDYKKYANAESPDLMVPE